MSLDDGEWTSLTIFQHVTEYKPFDNDSSTKTTEKSCESCLDVRHGLVQ